MSIFQTQLPISKVRRICKLDADSTMISSEAAQLITMATERFIGLLAKAAYGQAALVKRRTIQVKDIEECIRTHGLFEFLEGTLDGWPETSTTKKNNRSQASMEQKENLQGDSNEVNVEGKDSSTVDDEAKDVEELDSAQVKVSENACAS